MNATRRLHDAGQRLCLDHITRALLTGGGLARYIRDLSVSGLASNPMIFDQAISKNSTGTKDPDASDLLYVKSLSAPHTANTMPEKTLLALADHGEIGPMLPHDGGDAEAVLGRFAAAGIDLDALAEQLQEESAAAFVASWDDLLGSIAQKREAPRKAPGST